MLRIAKKIKKNFFKSIIIIHRKKAIGKKPYYHDTFEKKNLFFGRVEGGEGESCPLFFINIIVIVNLVSFNTYIISINPRLKKRN